MDPDEAELLEALNAFLRAPGEVFAEEWEGYKPRHSSPDVSCIWYQDPTTVVNEAFVFTDTMAEAWDALCDDPTFASWFEHYRIELDQPDVHNFLHVADGAKERLRRSPKGDITLYFPVEHIRAAENKIQLFRDLILRLLSARAARSGVGGPPATSHG